MTTTLLPRTDLLILGRPLIRMRLDWISQLSPSCSLYSSRRRNFDAVYIDIVPSTFDYKSNLYIHFLKTWKCRIIRVNVRGACPRMKHGEHMSICRLSLHPGLLLPLRWLSELLPRETSKRVMSRTLPEFGANRISETRSGS